MSHSPTPSSDYSSVPVDRVVQSVTNATKRLSQISTNTNLSAKKRKNQNRIGPWKLGRTLGRGLTGRVRLAKNIDTGKLAAVKIVPKSNFKKLENPKYRRLGSPDGKDHLPYGIEREIIIMKLIGHPNIMRLYDVWENKNDLYLILEYIEGGELFDYLIKRGKLQEFEAVSYFKQIIHGIGYLHQLNICHRDLKPENLLLDFNKNIKIADFGMAALEIKEKLLETSCGSPHYASPEIVAGKNYHGAPSDIWLCGIILFALLTGHLPFDDENIRKLLLKVQNGKFLMPPDLSLEAKDLISRMLRVNPVERVTIDEILEHPLLKKYPEPLSASASYLDLKKVTVQPIESVKKIDREILKNLAVLFHNCEEQAIVRKLLSPTRCSEKIFYYLLMKYRNEHNAAQNYDEDTDMTGSESKNSFPRSTSVVRTTVTDPSGSKHTTTTVQKIPASSLIPSSKSRRNALSNVTNTHTNSPKGKAFTASTSFTKKKAAMSHSSSRSLKSKTKPQIKRRPTGLLALDNVKDNQGTSLMNFERICQDTFEDSQPQRRHSRKLSAIERHERELALKVRKQNEERELRYRAEVEAKAEAAKIKLQAAKAAEARAEAERLKLEKARQVKEKKTKPTPKTELSDRRTVTEPVPTSSLDPRNKNMSSLLRAKSLTSPLSYSSLRTGPMNQNTTRVLQQLGVDLKPSKINEKVKTSSSRNLAAYLNEVPAEVDEDVTIDSFNEIEKENVTPAVERSLSQKSTRSLHSQRSSLSQYSAEKPRKTTMQYKSLLDGIDETGQTTPNIGQTPRMVRDHLRLPDTTLRSLDSRRTGLIPNPRFLRFSFNGLLGNLPASQEATSVPSQTVVTNSVLRNNTVKSRNSEYDDKTLPSLPTGTLKKSSNNLLGLGIDLNGVRSRSNSLAPSRQLSQRHARQPSSDSYEPNESHFVSVHLGESMAEHGESDDASQSTVLGAMSQHSHDDERTGFETDISHFDIVSNRSVEIGKPNKSRPSLVDNLIEAPQGDLEADKTTIKSLYKDYEKLYEKKAKRTSRASSNRTTNSSRTASTKVERPSHASRPASRDAETLRASDSDTLGRTETREMYGDDDGGEEVDENEHEKATQLDHDDAIGNGFDYDEHAVKDHGRDAQLHDSGLVRLKPLERAPTRASTQVFSTMAVDRLAQPPQSKQPPVPSPATIPTEDSGHVGRYSTVLRRVSLKPKREAPKAPGSDIASKGHLRLPRFSVQSKIYTADKPKTESKGWFRKLIDSLGAKKGYQSTGASEPQYNKKIQIVDSRLSASELMRVVRNTLEMKRIEGSVSKVSIDEEFGLINGSIPAKFTGGRKLKFRIEIMDLVNAASLHVENLRGPTRSFKNLVNIIRFIVEQEEQAFDRQDGYEFSGNRMSAVKA